MVKLDKDFAHNCFADCVDAVYAPAVITIGDLCKQMMVSIKDSEELTELTKAPVQAQARKLANSKFKEVRKQRYNDAPVLPLSQVGLDFIRSKIRNLPTQKRGMRLEGERLEEILDQMTAEEAKRCLTAAGRRVVACLVLEPDYNPPIQQEWLFGYRGAALDGLNKEMVHDLRCASPNLQLKSPLTFAKLTFKKK